MLDIRKRVKDLGLSAEVADLMVLIDREVRDTYDEELTMLRAAVLGPLEEVDAAERLHEWGDVMYLSVRSELGLVDRLRVLFTGRLTVKAQILCENPVGKTFSGARVRPEHFSELVSKAVRSTLDRIPWFIGRASAGDSDEQA